MASRVLLERTDLPRELARGQFEPLSARGSELERELAFGAVRQLLEAVVADPARGASRLTGSASAAAPVFSRTDAPAAALARLGRAGPGIAQALYVTPKTVEVHLTSAYRKLDLSSRRQLSEALNQA